MASWVIVASCCLLFASPVFGGGSSLCTYPLNEIKTLVFVDSAKDTWYYFSPCGNSSVDECGTATLCVNTSTSTVSPYWDALLTRSSDGLYKISYNSSGLELELWFSDGKFINGTLTSVLDEQVITLLTVKMAKGEKPGRVGDESKTTPGVNNLNLAIATVLTSLHATPPVTHDRSVMLSHATTLPLTPKMSHGGLRTSLPLIASLSGTRSINTLYLTTISPSSPPTITTNGYDTSNGTTSSLTPNSTTNSPVPTITTNAPMPTITTNGPLPTITTNGPLPTITTNGPLPTITANGSLPTSTPPVFPSNTGSLPTSTPPVFPSNNGSLPTSTPPVFPSSNGSLPTSTPPLFPSNNGSLPTSTPPVFPSDNGSLPTITLHSTSIMLSSFTPQSVHTSSSSNSQASSSPGSSPSTGLSCTIKIVIAVSVTFVATAVLAVIATLAVLIFYKRRAKKGSSYVQLAPTVYFDDDDE